MAKAETLFIPTHPRKKDPNWSYASAGFNSLQADLRPQAELTTIHSPLHGYYVTQEAFPKLYKDFQSMLKKAGMANAGYQLIISDQVTPYGGYIYSDQKLIYINQYLVNIYTYQNVVTSLVGHEIGHAWQWNHKGKTISNLPVLPGSHRRQVELLSDMLGVCFAGTKQGMESFIARNGHGGEIQHYPTIKELSSALNNLQWKDCPIDEMSWYAAPPPLLSTPPKLLSKRSFASK